MGLLAFALKGRAVKAQGEALGNVSLKASQAL